MKRKPVFVLLFLLLGLCQADAQTSEVEGSAEKIQATTMPSDDEDLGSEGSASGDSNETSSTVAKLTTTTSIVTTTTPIVTTTTPVVTTTTPIVTMTTSTVTTTTMVEVETDQREPKLMPTIPPSERDDEDSPGADIPNEKDEVEKKTDEEEEEPDVTTELEEDGGDVDVQRGGSTSFLADSQFLAALIVGGCVGVLFAVCVILLLAYRMRKKDEGSYSLDEQKKPSSDAYQYTQGQEYYA